MSARPLVFLDTEQDGLHPARRIYEIAMIRRDENGQRETSFFVSLNLANSDPQGLAIGRFFDRHPSGRKISGQPSLPLPGGQLVYSVHDAAKKVMEWTFGATIVGAVPSYDTETLGRMLRSEGYLPSWHHRLRCVETLTAGLAGEEIGGLRDCADHLEIPYDDLSLHTAMGDARLAMRIYDEIMQADKSATEGVA